MRIFFLLCCMCLTTRVQAEKSQSQFLRIPPPHPPPVSLWWRHCPVWRHCPQAWHSREERTSIGANLGPCSTVCRSPDASLWDFRELLFYAKSGLQDSELWCLMCASLHNAHTRIVLSLLYSLYTQQIFFRWIKLHFFKYPNASMQLSVANYV